MTLEGEGQTPVFTAYFMGGLCERTDEAATWHYAIAGMTIAMRDSSGLKYLLTDHLGSVVAVTDSGGTLISQQRYLPFGGLREDVGGVPRISETDFGYTGQRNLADMGLMDYRARFYDPTIARFVQPDTLIPSYANPQALNRFSYVLGNPILLNDPTGHREECGAYAGECDNPSSVVKPKTPPAQSYNRGRGDEEGAGVVDPFARGYTEEETEILKYLYENGGPDAVHGVNYILRNNIHIRVGSWFNWQNHVDTIGAWYDWDPNTGRKYILLNSSLWQDGQMPPADALALIIHEGRHLEQGLWLANTREGEMEAWKIGFRVAGELGDPSAKYESVTTVMAAQNVDEFDDAVQKFWPGYYGTGFWLLPKTPTSSRLKSALLMSVHWSLHQPSVGP